MIAAAGFRTLAESRAEAARLAHAQDADHDAKEAA